MKTRLVYQTWKKNICLYLRKLVHGQCHEMKAKAFHARKEDLMRPNLGLCGRLILANALRCCLQINCFITVSFLASPEIYFKFLWSHFWGLIPNQDRLIDADLELIQSRKIAYLFPCDFFTGQKNLNLALFIYKWNLEVYLFMFVSSLKRKGRARRERSWLPLQCEFH